MSQLRTLGLSALCVAVSFAPATAQDTDRIWGSVQLSDGTMHEGFIRWDRNEGSWVDLLDGVKTLPPENYLMWLRARGEDGPPVRTIDLLGYRISWNETDRDFSPTSTSGIRFGHLSTLRVVEPRKVSLELRSGEIVDLEGSSTDIGRSIRELSVQPGGGTVLEIEWEALESITFSAVPAGERATSPRLYGTVEDDVGRTFTGYLSWDLDEILESDVLDGREVGSRRDREIPFAEIAAIAKLDRGARVLLSNGEEIDLFGSNDVDRGHRGVQISEPGIGMVEVEWRDLRNVRFHRPAESTGYDAFDGGRPLTGTVETVDGEVLEGWIRWDADEGSSWEMLNGTSEGVAFSIELSRVETVRTRELGGAVVTLLDGRAFELRSSNDVSWGNRGVYVSDTDPGGRATAESWRGVEWEDVREVRFHPLDAGGARAPAPSPSKGRSEGRR